MFRRIFNRRASSASEANTPDFLQAIGNAMLDGTGHAAGKILLYAEVEQGVISADLLWEDAGQRVRFRFAPEPLKNTLYSYWASSEFAAARWRTFRCVVYQGRFDVHLSYPDKLVPTEDVSDRRPREIKAVFGDMPVDYSSPS